MIKRISHTEEIEKRLKKEKKVKYLDKPRHFKRMKKMNKAMDELKRESAAKKFKGSDVIYRGAKKKR